MNLKNGTLHSRHRQVYNKAKRQESVIANKDGCLSLFFRRRLFSSSHSLWLSTAAHNRSRAVTHVIYIRYLFRKLLPNTIAHVWAVVSVRCSLKIRHRSQVHLANCLYVSTFAFVLSTPSQHSSDTDTIHVNRANGNDVTCGGGVGHDGLAVYSRDVNGRVVPVAVNVHELRHAYGLRDPLCSPQH